MMQLANLLAREHHRNAFLHHDASSLGAWEIQAFETQIVGPWSSNHLLSAFVTGKIQLESKVRPLGAVCFRPLFWYMHLLLGEDPVPRLPPPKSESSGTSLSETARESASASAAQSAAQQASHRVTENGVADAASSADSQSEAPSPSPQAQRDRSTEPAPDTDSGARRTTGRRQATADEETPLLQGMSASAEGAAEATPMDVDTEEEPAAAAQERGKQGEGQGGDASAAAGKEGSEADGAEAGQADKAAQGDKGSE